MANVFLKKPGNATSDSLALNSASDVFGDALGQEELVVQHNGASFPTGMVVEQTIEKVTLTGALSDFTFASSGTTDVLVYRSNVLVATIRPQTDDDVLVSGAGNGTELAFTSGSVLSTTLHVISATEMRIGGLAGQVLTPTAAVYAPDFAPTLSSFTPLDNATTVAPSANVVLTFSEDVSAVTGKNVVIHKASDDSVVTSIDAADSKISIAGGVVTINPAADLTGGTEYYVLVDAGAFKDTTGNDYAGQASKTAISFTPAALPTGPGAITLDQYSRSEASTISTAYHSGISLRVALKNNTATVGDVYKVYDGSMLLGSTTLATNSSGQALNWYNGTVQVYLSGTLAPGAHDLTATVTAVGTTIESAPSSPSTITIQSGTVQTGTDADNTITGDTVTTYPGKVDYIDGGNGSDTITGGAGPDMLRGGAGDDVFLVNASSDLYQNGASEIIDGGDGNDTLRLNAVGSFDAYSFPFSSIETFELNAADTTGSWAFSIRSLTGNANNTLTMKVGTGITLTQQMNINAELVTDATQKLVVNPGLTSGTMTISGTSGNDSLQGGAGNDTIKAGPGTDYVDGGAGDDVFVYQTSHGSIAGETYIGGTGSDTLKLLVSFTTTNGYTTYEDMPEGNYIDLTTVAALTSLENIDTRTSVGVERVKMRYDQRWASDSGVTYVNGPYFKAGSNDYLYLTALPSNQHVIVESSDTASTNPTQVLVFDQGAQGIILERFYSNTIHNDQLDLRKVLRDGGFIANEAGGLFQTAITSSSHAVDNGVYYMDGAAAAETPATLAGSFTDKLAAGDQALLVHAYSTVNPLATISTPQSERYLYGFQVVLVENTGTITGTEVLRSSGVWSNVTSGTWTDNYGLGSNGIDAGNFLTGTYLGTAAIAPELWSSTPADNATSVAPHNNLVLSFDENVKAGSGNIVITNAADATDTRTIAVTDTTQVTISNKVLTINPTNDLLGLSNYSVTMASGVISDNYDHAFAGISDATTLNFTTSVEVTAPTLVSSTPADGSAGLVGANASIVLTFSENVKVGTGDIVLTSTTNAANNKTIAVGDAQVVFSNNTVTITPTGGLAQWNHYNVTMAAGVIKDMVGNDYAGISDATTLNFTTTGTNPYTPNSPILGLMASSNGAASGLVFGFLDINGSGVAGDTVSTVDDQYTWTEFAAAITTFNTNNSGPDLRMATKAELEALRADPSINTNQISLPNGPVGWAPPTQADDSPDYWVSDEYQTGVHYYVSTPGYGYNAVADSNIAYAAVVLVGLGV